jgi:hypothetical protein
MSVTYNIVYPGPTSKFCTYDIVGHLRPPMISKVVLVYDIVELRYRSLEHDIVGNYDIGTYDIVGNYDIGTYEIVGNYDIGGGKVPDGYSTMNTVTHSHSGGPRQDSRWLVYLHVCCLYVCM